MIQNQRKIHYKFQSVIIFLFFIQVINCQVTPVHGTLEQIRHIHQIHGRLLWYNRNYKGVFILHRYDGRCASIAKGLIVGFICTWLFFLLPAFMFKYYEGWTFFQGVYYAFITLSTIGFGDYVAGECWFLLVVNIFANHFEQLCFQPSYILCDIIQFFFKCNTGIVRYDSVWISIILIWRFFPCKLITFIYLKTSLFAMCILQLND